MYQVKLKKPNQGCTKKCANYADVNKKTADHAVSFVKVFSYGSFSGNILVLRFCRGMVGDCTDVRIIAGTAKGIRLKTPKGMNTRPTADRVKESVFGILGADVIDAQVLDLFAGTGNLGFEALSRGAASATMIDKNIQSVKIIMENSILTDLTRATVICREDVIQALRRFKTEEKSFDLIFCDPPYNLGLAPKVLLNLDSNDVLRTDGILVLEHSKHEKLPDELKRIVAYRSEFYGETVVSFFRKQEGINSENCSVPGEF